MVREELKESELLKAELAKEQAEAIEEAANSLSIMLGICEDAARRTVTQLLQLVEPIQEFGKNANDVRYIAILEECRKHCKNYLEKKQIDRELNMLKFKNGRRNRK